MDSHVSLIVMVLLMVVPGVLVALWMSRLMRIRVPAAILLTIGIDAGAMTVLAMAHDYDLVPERGSTLAYLHDRLNKWDGPLVCALVLIAANLSVALIYKLYAAFVLNKATDAERQIGVTGVRAWLSPLNVIAVITIWVAAVVALDFSLVGMLILCLGVLLAYPIVRTLSQAPRIETTPPQAPAEERQRVLALVEAGKISAEDAAELLSALAQSQTAAVQAGAAITISPARRILIAGAAVTLVGFLLPWFTINITRAMDSAINSVQSQMQQFTNGMPSGFSTAPSGMPQEVPAMQVPTNALTQLTVRGGDIHDGLGWIILASGLVAAGLPFFWPVRPANAHQHRNVVLCAVGVGTVALLYVLSGSFNAVTSIEMGFIVTIAGYGLMWVGAVREYVAGRTMPAAVAMA